MAYLIGEVDRSKPQNATQRYLLEGARTTLAMHMVPSQRCISNYVGELQKLAAESASLDVTFQNHCADFDSKISILQTTPENEKESADGEAKRRKKLFVVKNGPKA